MRKKKKSVKDDEVLISATGLGPIIPQNREVVMCLEQEVEGGFCSELKFVCKKFVSTQPRQNCCPSFLPKLFPHKTTETEGNSFLNSTLFLYLRIKLALRYADCPGQSVIPTPAISVVQRSQSFSMRNLSVNNFWQVLC